MGGRKRLPTVCLRKTAAVPLAAGAVPLVPPVPTLVFGERPAVGEPSADDGRSRCSPASVACRAPTGPSSWADAYSLRHRLATLA